ncbi:MAG TPA: ATP-dependent 6-phosphofructokinase [Chthoniobacterales bacterium]
MSHYNRSIAVLTSGGDSPGMNPAVRAVALIAIRQGYKAVGYQNGYDGIFDDNTIDLSGDLLSGLLERGGTVLQSSRCKRMMTPEGQAEAVAKLRSKGVDGLVVIGGDGSLTGALKIHQLGFPVVGIPGTIDNDIYGTQMGVGVDTASNTIVEMIDKIKDTARSHRRCFLVEVMGRGSGYLALTTAIACGGEVAIIPEYRYNMERILELLAARYRTKRKGSLIILAEGVCSAEELIKRMKEGGGDNVLQQEVRRTVLGHVQRGGSPSHYDRMLATRMGELAVMGLLQSETGTMASLRDGKVTLVDLEYVLSRKRPISPTLTRLAKNMGIEFGDAVEV